VRILFVTPLYLPWVGGLEILVQQLSAEFRSRGHEIVILTSHGEESSEGLDDVDGVAVFRIGSHDAIESRDAARILRAQADISKIDEWFDPQVVHAHDVGPVLWLYRRVVRRRRRPLVVTLHNQMTRIFRGSVPILAKILTEADLVTGVSRAVVDDTWTYAPAVASRMSVIENGVLPPSDDVGPPPPRHPARLLCAGRLVEQKGFDIAIEAVARLAPKHPDLILTVAGSGPEEASLRRRAVELGVDRRVEFLGTVDRSSMVELLRACTAVVMPSRFEGLPLVALEAAWMGRPVVATTDPGVASAIIDGETGLLVPVDEPVALAQAISTLLADPERCLALGRAARAMAARDYSLARCADEYEQLYRVATIAPDR
jgi:glycogen(starch) synthase